jgi:GntR family transcriptional regulator, arabinose operon transcriptional repressor
MPDRKVDARNPMPRYYQLYSSLLERIQENEFQPGQQLPTERQLGEEYAVSRITVTKALDLLKLDGYVERQQGRGTFVASRPLESLPPSEQRVPSPIAFVCPVLSGNAYLSAILTGIAGVCARYGYPLQVYGFVDDSVREAAAIEEALTRGAQGLIVYSWQDHSNLALHQHVQSRGIPLVYVDRYYPEIDSDRVVWDDARCAYESTRYLIGLGHRRIAFVPTSETRPTSTLDRLAGYRQAVEEQGLGYDEDLVWLDMAGAFPSLQPGPDISDRLICHLQQADGPSALLTVNDGPAQAIIHVLQTLVAGAAPLADRAARIVIATTSATNFTPSLPFVSLVAVQHGDVLGSEAAELMVQRLGGAMSPGYQHIVKSMSLVECGPKQGCAGIPDPT